METSQKYNFPFVIKVLMLMALVIAGAWKNKFLDEKAYKQEGFRQSTFTPFPASFKSTSTNPN